MLAFINPGVIDSVAITTMGINAKSGHAIGIFGTGLKFAIAVLLRHGHRVTIVSGGITYEFGSRTVIVRDKPFDIVTMNTRQRASDEELKVNPGAYDITDGGDLGFTTQLGRNWKLWQAYRELYCNCVTDEGGTVELIDDDSPFGVSTDYTGVFVVGEGLEREHERRNEFILDPERKPLLVVPNVVEVYEGASWSVFYRGIKVGNVPGDEGARYTYNVLSWMHLSEDREMLLSSQFTDAVAAAVTSGLDLKYTEDVIALVDDNGIERKGIETRINYGGNKLIDAVFQTAKRVIENTKKRVPASFMMSFREYERENLLSRRVTVTDEENQRLQDALAACRRVGLIWSGTVEIAAELGTGIDVTGKDDVILVSVHLLRVDAAQRLRIGLAMKILELQSGKTAGSDDFLQALFERLFANDADRVTAIDGHPVIDTIGLAYTWLSDGHPAQAQDVLRNALLAAKWKIKEKFPWAYSEYPRVNPVPANPERHDVAKLLVVTGEWSRNGKISYREIVEPDEIPNVRDLNYIHFTDGTTLTLRTDEIHPNDRVGLKEIKGYAELVREAAATGKRHVNVADL